MSYNSLSENQVKGRKKYFCSWCGEVINKGEVHKTRTYIFDGDFNSSREHLECAKAMQLVNWDNCDGSYEQHSYKRGSTECKWN